jgi:hypothetical protein
MLEINPVKAPKLEAQRPTKRTRPRTACLLCRVLLPTVVQHRHLLFDAVRRQRRPFVQRCTPGNTQFTGRLVFHYSEEISIDGSSSSWTVPVD